MQIWRYFNDPSIALRRESANAPHIFAIKCQL